MATQALDPIEKVLIGNKAYCKRIIGENPGFFDKLASGQSPEVLWLGCADSRVPETTVCACQPGDIFVHRNIANCIRANDSSSAAVIEYAVAFLKVKRILICGHTKCGGAAASLGDADLGETLNSWLGPVREIRRKNEAELSALPDDDARGTRLAELNVLAGLEVLRKNPTVAKHVSERGLQVQGGIFDIRKGELRLL